MLANIISYCLMLSVAIMCAMSVTNYIETKEYVNNVFDDYLLDAAVATGNLCSILYSDNNGAIPAVKYTQYLGSLKIEQLPSSYFYVVDAATSSACEDIASGATSQAQETSDAAAKVNEIGEFVDKENDAIENLRTVSRGAVESVNDARAQLDLV